MNTDLRDFYYTVSKDEIEHARTEWEQVRLNANASMVAVQYVEKRARAHIAAIDYEMAKRERAGSS